VGWSVSSNPTPAAAANAASNAIDGDLTSRFSTETAMAPGFYYQINLGSMQSFSQVTLDSDGNAGDAALGYSVTVSNDGTTWSAPVATGTGGVAFLAISFPEQTAQYVRVTQTGTAATSWWSLYEINLWAQQPLVQTPASGAPTPLSRTAWVASAFPVNNDVAANAIDGNLTTRYSPDQPQTPWQYFQVNLGSAQTFSQATIDAAGFGGDYPRAYEIFVSNDGVSWGSPVAVGLGSAQTITVQFPPQTSKYVRVSIADEQASNYWSLAEFNLLE
jgi:beta-glucosidase